MGSSLNSINNRSSYRTGKRFFITLLILNSFIGCVYLIREQREKQIEQTTFKHQEQTAFKRQEQNQYPIEKTKAIKFIQAVLENEYNQNDLFQFYKHVHKEYSLGLRCTRTQNVTNTTGLSNAANRIKSKKTKTSSSLVAPTKRSHSSHPQRTDLNTYLIDNSDACLNKSIDLLIIVISKSDNYKTRDAIRRTWGSRKRLGIYPSLNVKFFFLIDFDEKLSHNIRLENNIFHDIIQVELPQQYTLVTHRVISLFEWSFRYCRTAKYLFKTDDDIFINLILLLKFISPLVKQQIDNSFLISDMNIYGYKHVDPPVFRYSESSVVARYIVTYDEFPCERYPSFLSGFGYVISKKARDAILYTAYQDPEPFRISDVYLTGIIPNYLSITNHFISNYTIQYDGDCEPFFNQSRAFACATDFHHQTSNNDVFTKYYKIWQIIQQNMSSYIN